MGQICQDSQPDLEFIVKDPKIKHQNSSLNQILIDKNNPFANLSEHITQRLRQIKPKDDNIQQISKLQIIKLANGTNYQGHIDNSQMSGQCRLITPDQSYFQGHILHNSLNGYGLLIHREGEYYLGQFKNSKAEGKGLYKGEDFFYQGLFQNNLYQGYGKLTTVDEEYQGLFQKGKFKRGKHTKLKDEIIQQVQFQKNIEKNLQGKQEMNKNIKINQSQERVLKGEFFKEDEESVDYKVRVKNEL